MGHRKNDCQDFKHLKALQRRQRQVERMQMQRSAFRHHQHHMQGLQMGHNPQTPYAPMQVRPMANTVGYPQSQVSGVPGSQILPPTIFPAQLSAMGSVYGMPSPSMQQSTTEMQTLRDQLARLQQQLQALQGQEDLPGGEHARMHSAQAIVNEVHQMQGGVSDLIFHEGTTHHVARSPHLLFSLRSSHINNVLVAGGESHEAVGQGDMIPDTSRGDGHQRCTLCTIVRCELNV
jgi:hypothetical protein